MSSPADLAVALASVSEPEYVRCVADWLTRPTDVHLAPPLTGEIVIDALVAASAAHVAFEDRGEVPPWTQGPGRRTTSFWYPGPASLLPNALVHTPLSFALHGVLIEADSLASV